MEDPRFPRRGGANHKGGGTNLIFCSNSPKNCNKMTEFGIWRSPLDQPMVPSGCIATKWKSNKEELCVQKVYCGYFTLFALKLVVNIPPPKHILYSCFIHDSYTSHAKLLFLQQFNAINYQELSRACVMLMVSHCDRLETYLITRKSSCVNARGIPPAV